MANVLNRTTLAYLESVNTPDYDPAIWIINPDMTPVAAVPQRYWKVEGDSVVEMTQAEKDATDAAIAATFNGPPSDPAVGDTWIDPLDSAHTAYQWSGTKWLSVARDILMFSRSGGITEGNLAVGTVLHANAGFTTSRDLNIFTVSATITDGDPAKVFTILGDNDMPHFEFSLGDMTYCQRDLDIDIPRNDTIRCFVGANGGGTMVYNPVVQVELAWRWVPPS